MGGALRFDEKDLTIVYVVNRGTEPTTIEGLLLREMPTPRRLWRRRAMTVVANRRLIFRTSTSPLIRTCTVVANLLVWIGDVGTKAEAVPLKSGVAHSVTTSIPTRHHYLRTRRHHGCGRQSPNGDSEQSNLTHLILPEFPILGRFQDRCPPPKSNTQRRQRRPSEPEIKD
jgi:hypothetical protein